jgi:hypothetical protein
MGIQVGSGFLEPHRFRLRKRPQPVAPGERSRRRDQGAPSRKRKAKRKDMDRARTGSSGGTRLLRSEAERAGEATPEAVLSRPRQCFEGHRLQTGEQEQLFLAPLPPIYPPLLRPDTTDRPREETRSHLHPGQLQQPSNPRRVMKRVVGG